MGDEGGVTDADGPRFEPTIGVAVAKAVSAVGAQGAREVVAAVPIDVAIEEVAREIPETSARDQAIQTVAQTAAGGTISSPIVCCRPGGADRG